MVQEQENKSWHWQARNVKKNIARDYHLHASTDLFGWTIVERSWGRIGGKLTSQRLSFRDRQAADSFVTGIIRRRQSAQRRIGAAYELVLS